MADAAFIGSSGSMVTTTLESLGYYYQSYILDEVGHTIAGPMGGLVYTVGAIMAMTSFMMTGRYKFWLWFFLGPGIFFLILSSRTETAGSDWKFGLDVRIRDGVEIEVRNVIDRQGFDFGESAQVSSLFAGFNRVTSRVIGEIVRVLNNGRAKADLRFILRSELAAYMRSQNDMENGLRELLQGTLLRNCAQYVEAGRKSKDVSISDEERSAAQAEFARLESTRDVRVSEGAITYITGRLVAGEPVQGFAPVEAAAPEEYQQKFDETRQIVRETPLSCDDVWNIVYVGVMENAERTLQRARDIAEANGMDEAEQRRLEQDFNQLLGMKNQAGLGGPERAAAMTKAIALYTLRNETNSLINSPFIDDYVNRGRTRNLQTPSEKQLSQVERARVENKEWSEKTRAMTTAATLPYYQGVGLLVLSIAFPFFALLLLIPGKHTGFLLWFQLWVWLKSWDIGFAVVMMLDDLLFSIMGTGPPAAPNNVQLPDDFATAIFTLKEIDPTFQMGTYYTLIALALQSIPAISGYLVMGSASAGSSILSAGAQPFADELSGGALSAQGQYHTTGNRYANMSDVLGATEKGLANANAGSSEPGIPRPIPNPYNGDLDNFLSSISSFEGMRPYGNDPSKVRPWMGYSAESADQMARDAEADRGNAGYLQGFGRGLPEGNDPITSIQRMIGGGGDILDQLGSGKLSVRSAELQASTHWDRTFVISGPVAQGRVADGRLYNAFEIPQVEGGGYNPERDAEVVRMFETKDLIKSFLMFGNNIFDTGNVVSRSIRGGGGNGGGGAAAAGVGAALAPGGAAGATGAAGTAGGTTTSSALGALLWMLTPGNAGAAEGPEGATEGVVVPKVTRQALARAAEMTTASNIPPKRRRTVRRVVRTVTESPAHSDQFQENGFDSGAMLDERSVANGGGENYLTRGVFGQSEVGAPATAIGGADGALEMQNALIESGKFDSNGPDVGKVAGRVIGAIPGSDSDGVVMLADGTVVPLGIPTAGSDQKSAPQDMAQIGLAPTQSEIEAFALLNSDSSRLDPFSDAARRGELGKSDDTSEFAANAARGQSLGWSSDISSGVSAKELGVADQQQSLSSEPSVFRPEVFGEPSDYAGPVAGQSPGENRSDNDSATTSLPGFEGLTLTTPNFVSGSISGASESSGVGMNASFMGETSTQSGAANGMRQQESLSAEPALFSSPVFGGPEDYSGPGPTTAPNGSGRGGSQEEASQSGFEGVTLSTPSFSSVGVAGPSDGFTFGSNSSSIGDGAALDITPRETRQQEGLSDAPSVFNQQVFGEPADYSGPGLASSPAGSERDGSTAASFSGFEGVTLSTPSFSSVGVAGPSDGFTFGSNSSSIGDGAALDITPRETRQREGLSDAPSVFNQQVFGQPADYSGPGLASPPAGSERDSSATASLSGFEGVALTAPSFASSDSTVAADGPVNFASALVANDIQPASRTAEQDPFTAGLSATASVFAPTSSESTTAVTSNTAYASLYAAPTAEAEARAVDNAPSWANSFIGQDTSSSKQVELAASSFEAPRDTNAPSSGGSTATYGSSSAPETPVSGFAESMRTFNAVDPAERTSSAGGDRDPIATASWAFSSDSAEFVTSRGPESGKLTGNSWTAAEIETVQQSRQLEREEERQEIPLAPIAETPQVATQAAETSVEMPVPAAQEEPAPASAAVVEAVDAEPVQSVSSGTVRSKARSQSGAARKSKTAAQVIVHAPEEEKKSAPSADAAGAPDEAPTLGMAMDESRLTAERERLEQVATGLIESLKQLEAGDPIAAAVSSTTQASIRSISYRAADGFDRPVVVVDGIRDSGHLIVANDDIVRELTGGGSGIVARPTAGAQLADPDTTVVVSATEAGTLVGLEQSVALAERNGGDRGAIDRMVEQLDLTRADIAGALSREFARLDGALEFGALKAQNDYLKSQHERSTFADDEAITRYLAQGSGVGKPEYVANLVERYASSLYGSEGTTSGLSDQFVERLPGREIFREDYVKPLEQSAFQYQQDRAAELQAWSITESVNGESRLSFDTVTALGLGLQTTGATFEEQKREQQQLVEALSSRLLSPEQSPQLEVEKVEALRTAFQYTVGADAELKFEDYAKVVQQMTQGNDAEAKRWLSGDQFLALVKEFGKPEGAA